MVNLIFNLRVDLRVTFNPDDLELEVGLEFAKFVVVVLVEQPKGLVTKKVFVILNFVEGVANLMFVFVS